MSIVRDKITGVASFVCAATAAAALCRGFCGGASYKNEQILRKYANLQRQLHEIKVRRSILSGRVVQNFSIFCKAGPIDAKVNWSGIGINDTLLVDTNISLIACRAITWVMITSVIFLGILLVIPKSRFPVSDYLITIPFAAITAMLIVVFLLSTLSVLGCGDSDRNAKVLKELQCEYKEELRAYERLVKNINLYNSLPECARYEIEKSGYLCEIVQSRILEGKVTEEFMRTVIDGVIRELDWKALICA